MLADLGGDALPMWNIPAPDGFPVPHIPPPGDFAVPYIAAPYDFSAPDAATRSNFPGPNVIETGQLGDEELAKLKVPNGNRIC